MRLIGGMSNMQVIYVEKALRHHPRVLRIINRFQQPEIIYCDHYREVFNRKAQNFRLQKQNPALLLAEKPGHRVLSTPKGFGIGGIENYYFSHMLNCLYDCRYCFLQGMYPSAHYVVFVNYEDFMHDIRNQIAQYPDKTVYFFSGYDADSLAYEPVTGFLAEFLPFFAEQSRAFFELRTKSANVNALLKTKPLKNVVVAFSFTPSLISEQVEHKVPSVAKRIASLKLLADAGWSIGLRFDPLIYANHYQELYAQLLEDIFIHLNVASIHSVSVGPLRFPVKMYDKLLALYPEDRLLAHPLQRRNHIYTYREDKEEAMKQFLLQHLQKYLPKTLLFECQAS